GAVELCGLGQEFGQHGAIPLASRWSRIAEPVVVAVVAEDRGVDRLALEEVLPEAIGHLVDGAARGDVGHEVLQRGSWLGVVTGTGAAVRRLARSPRPGPGTEPGRRGRHPRGP